MPIVFNEENRLRAKVNHATSQPTAKAVPEFKRWPK
jgi:hypothetical protein